MAHAKKVVYNVDTNDIEVRKPRKPGTEDMIEVTTKGGQRRLVSPSMRPLRQPFKYDPVNLPPEWQDNFLDELRMVPIVSRAARMAGVSRRTAYAYREIDPEFKKAWDDAEEEGRDKNDECLIELRDAGKEAVAIFLARVWRYGGTDVKPKTADTKILVGWEDEK